MAQPDVDNMKTLTASWVTENIGEVVIALNLIDNALSVEIVTCSVEGNDVIFVSSSNITNEVIIRELPCYTESVKDTVMTSELQRLLEGIINVTNWGNDGLTTAERGDYDDSTIKYRIEL